MKWFSFSVFQLGCLHKGYKTQKKLKNVYRHKYRDVHQVYFFIVWFIGMLCTNTSDKLFQFLLYRNVCIHYTLDITFYRHMICSPLLERPCSRTTTGKLLTDWYRYCWKEEYPSEIYCWWICIYSELKTFCFSL